MLVFIMRDDPGQRWGLGLGAGSATGPGLRKLERLSFSARALEPWMQECSVERPRSQSTVFLHATALLSYERPRKTL